MPLTLENKSFLTRAQSQEPGEEIYKLCPNEKEATNLSRSLKYHANKLCDLSIKIYRRYDTVFIKKQYWRRYFYNE